MLPNTLPQLLLWIGLILVVAYIAFGFHAVNQWERQPVMFFGKYAWTAGPGIIWVPPIIFQLIKLVPVQDEVFTITVEARTSDNIPLKFDFTFASQVLPDRVKDVVVKVRDGIGAVLKLADTAAVRIIGHTKFQDVQGKDEGGENQFANNVLTVLQSLVDDWGIRVSKPGISNIVITDQSIAESVSNIAKAAANAKTEEILAKELAGPAASLGVSVWQLRQLIAMTNMSGSTIIPSDLVGIMNSIPKEALAKLQGAAKSAT
jgi:regulator of protease activity HflC (stomatin/prohibitin superfamily)